MSENKKELKKSFNKFQIVGTIDEINLMYDAEIINKNNSKLKGAIVKKEFKNPSLTIESNGEIYGLEFFPTYCMKEEKGKLIENPRFKALQTIMEYEKGKRVMAECSVSENSYANEQGEFKAFPQLNTFQITSSGVPEKDVADGKLTGMVKSILPEIKNEEETGRLIVEFCYLSGGADGGINVIPLKIIVDKDLSDDFKDLYELGDCCQLDLEVLQVQIGGDNTVKEGHFGRRESNITMGFTITEFNVFGGDPKLDEENDKFIEMEKMKELLKERDILIASKIQAKKAKGTEKSKNGLGTKKSSVKPTDEDDPFA